MTLDVRDPAGTELLDFSVGLLRDLQEPGGAWLACPNFPTYRYCWLRDGVFIGRALDVVGAHEHTAAFYRWSADTITTHAHKIERLHQARADLPPDQPLPSEFALHPRFTVDGREVDGEWGNVQLDGYGLWLTGLADHLRATGRSSGAHRDAIEAVVRYLTLAWDLPCYDTWEEYPARRHTTTIAAVARGLTAASHDLGSTAADRAVPAMLELLRTRGTHDGALTKFVTDDHRPALTTPDPATDEGPVAGHERVGRPLPPHSVDASVLLVLDDYGPFSHDTELTRRTLRRVTADLATGGGGVHRYLDDEYYGGGLWLVLAGGLANIRRREGDRIGWAEVVGWIEQQADADGQLAEQVPHELRRPELHRPWIERWGPIATPLLWSHAMYVIARS